jgi:dienelactone hydrolase
MNSLNQAFDALQAVKAMTPRGFTKFGYMGESQGGNAVLWADKQWFRSEYRRVFHSQDQQFGAMVALYPGCFERSYADKFLDSPLLIMTGDDDNNTPAALCRNYVNYVISREGDAEFIGLPHQHHDFDAPYYATKTSAQNPSHCASTITRTNRTWDETGEVFPLTSDGSAAFWKKCFAAAGNAIMVGGNSGDPKTGYKQWMAFFQGKLSPGR